MSKEDMEKALFGESEDTNENEDNENSEKSLREAGKERLGTLRESTKKVTGRLFSVGTRLRGALKRIGGETIVHGFAAPEAIKKVEDWAWEKEQNIDSFVDNKYEGMKKWAGDKVEDVKNKGNEAKSAFTNRVEKIKENRKVAKNMNRRSELANMIEVIQEGIDRDLGIAEEALSRSERAEEEKGQKEEELQTFRESLQDNLDELKGTQSFTHALAE